MRNARMLVLVGALVAGVLAAVLIVSTPEPEPQVIVKEGPKQEIEEVLIAAVDLNLGKPLGPDDMEWQEWPKQFVGPSLIVKSQSPEAMEDLEGSLVRFTMFAGDPIREQRLVSSDGGYLSALLPKGKRALGVSVKPITTAGGFILPGDKVDVLLTHNSEETDELLTEIILENIRVLAIDTTTQGQQESGSVIPNRTATLELKPEETEVIALAQERGTITLALRSVADSADNAPRLSLKREKKTTNTITFIRYGRTAQSATTSAGN
ncbi:Flp pilus assembly protein CpaB [Polycladidibacter hongkongensis]|uniref:Flp pilus assembly protein CpaB n=1 Tax=Polycladidibacter hongkongensis TaxID=1647556 RepID=UPI000832B764|nr:Flp pilus assembly protein CpaB [Pseudovibrio hongkongensis]